MHSVLLIQYLKWHFFDAPRDILQAWGNVLWFGLNFFSTPLLLRTLFSPWRRITWSYGRGFQLGNFFFTLASNIVSRIMGAIVRSVIIVFGIIFEIFLLVSGGVVFAFWIFLPILIILALVYGVLLLF